MEVYHEFVKQGLQEIEQQGRDQEFQRLCQHWMNRAEAHNYTYHFEWMGRPVIQYPQDLMAMHQLIWAVRPDVIIETGIAHGGSLVFYASQLALLELCGLVTNPKVIGVDVCIRPHNRKALEEHPFASRLTLIEGSSVAPETLQEVQKHIPENATVMVALDSNHSHEHVLAELQMYAPLVSLQSYCVVFDTSIEFLDKEYPDRPWSKGNNAYTAVHAYLQEQPNFIIDRTQHDRIGISECPDGFLKRIA